MTNNNSNIPWIEKYRPTDINDVILPTIIAKEFARIIETRQINNIILTGDSGTGKTTSIICLAKKLYGDKINTAFKELNASDERGVSVVRIALRQFCMLKTTGLDCKKIILFDEADKMTDQQQIAINELMTEFSKTTAFFFTCNSSLKIIEPIQSKCIIILYYAKLTTDVMKKLLIKVCKKENITYDDEGLLTIIEHASGDMRKAYNNLHFVYYNKTKITTENVFAVSDIPEPSIIKKIIDKCYAKDMDVLNDVKYLRSCGYSSQDILQGLIDYIKKGAHTDNRLLISLMNNFCKTKIVISNGVDSNLQLYACLLRIIQDVY